MDFRASRFRTFFASGFGSIQTTAVSPNPAMVTGLCFFAVVIFLSQRIKSQEILGCIAGCFGADRSKLGINASPR